MKIEITKDEHSALMQLLNDISEIRYDQLNTFDQSPDSAERYLRCLQQTRTISKLIAKLSQYRSGSPADGEMLSPNELAEMWGVSVYTIHRLANSKNGLRAYKVGSLTRFRVTDVVDYMTANEIKAPEKPRDFACERFTYKPGMKVVSL